MPRLRRTRYLAFTCQDEPLPDFPALLRGEATIAYVRRTYALSILRGKAFPVTSDELEVLLSLPSERWVDTDGIDGQIVQRLAQLGLVVTDDEDEGLAELASRDRALEAGQWNLHGALAHFLTKWRDVDLGAAIGEADADELPAAIYDAIDGFVAKHGPAPPAFHTLEDPPAVHALPLVERRDGLFAALAQRKTTRRFDRDARMTIEELATVLYYVFGCHGYAKMAGNGLMVKRTSPSGGGLHPIEVVPAWSPASTGSRPGCITTTSATTRSSSWRGRRSEAAEMAAEFVCGQRYFASANVLFLMTGPVLPLVLEVPAPPEGLRSAHDGRGPPEPDALPRRRRARARGLRHRGDQRREHRGPPRYRRLERRRPGGERLRQAR